MLHINQVSHACMMNMDVMFVAKGKCEGKFKLIYEHDEHGCYVCCKGKSEGKLELIFEWKLWI